jgi:hypothetical protein
LRRRPVAVTTPERSIVVDEQWNESDEVSDVHTPDGAASTGVTEGRADASDVPPQYGVGPFSIREVALVGVWVVAFVVSFFSLHPIRFDSVWTSGLTWVLTIGVPSVAVFLIVLRRLSPEGIRRVGSLGIDQFASVAFSVSAVIWLTYIWETVAIVAQGGPWVRSWVIWVEFVLMLIGVFLTVFAPFIPPFAEDFDYRREVPAHRNARPVRAVTARPAPEPRAEPEPAFADYAPVEEPYATAAQGLDPYQAPASDAPSAQEVEPTDWAPSKSRDTYEAVDVPAETQVRHQAFWALAPEERDVVDEVGVPVFRIGPTAWALVIEDRGDSFVVRNEDGRVGFLHDISDVTRG